MKRSAAVMLMVVSLAAHARAEDLPPYPAGTNGCSGGISLFWRQVLKRVPSWETCCYEHDREYRRYGIWTEKARSDRKLLACIAEKNPAIGAAMFTAVIAIGQIFFKYDLSRIGEDYAAQSHYGRAGAE